MQRVSLNSQSLGRLLDIAVIFTSFQLTYYIIDKILHHVVFVYGGTKYYETFLIVSGCWILSTFIIGEYPVRRLNGFAREITIVIRVNVVALLAFAFVSYILRLSLSRSYLLVSFIVICLCMLTIRAVARFLLGFIRSGGKDAKTRLIIGSTTSTHEYLGYIESHPQLGIRIIGYLADDINGLYVPYLGLIANLRNTLASQPVDGIVIALPVSHPAFEEVVRECELQGVQLEVMLDGISSRIARSTIAQSGGIPRLVMTQTPHTPESLVLKRITDFVLSLFAVILFSPIMLLITIAIKLDDGGPIFFSQERSGLNHKTFRMLKFRSMHVDAELRKEQLLHLNEMDGPVFKIKQDPRITRTGLLLRKTSLDELPQFINVLFGHMSLVGPRPPLPSEVNQYDPYHRRRLSVKPGITRLWQISGRNEIDFNEWVNLDLRYIDSWTYLGDWKILMQTIPAVLRRRGAS